MIIERAVFPKGTSSSEVVDWMIAELLYNIRFTFVH